MIELGGNIKLEGFDDLEPMKLIVAKKIIGNFAKQVSEAKGDSLQMFKIIKKNNDIYAHAQLSNEIIKVESKGNNWFCTLGQALQEIVKKTR